MILRDGTVGRGAWPPSPCAMIVVDCVGNTGSAASLRLVATPLFAAAPTLARLLLAAVARHAALAARFARLLARPLVRGALLVRRLAALACILPLLRAVHRCESAIFFGHRIPLPGYVSL